MVVDVVAFAIVFYAGRCSSQSQKNTNTICKAKNHGVFGSKDSQRNFRRKYAKEKESLDSVWNEGTLISFSKERES